MHLAGRIRRTPRRGAIAAMVVALAWLPGAATAQVTTQQALGPVGSGAEPSGKETPVVELQGDEPLAQYLIRRFMQGHPDLSWRLRGREAYAAGDYARARDHFERAARFADKP